METCTDCGGSGYATTSDSISAGVYCCSCKAGDLARDLLRENRKYVEDRAKVARLERELDKETRKTLELAVLQGKAVAAREAAEAKCERVREAARLLLVWLGCADQDKSIVVPETDWTTKELQGRCAELRAALAEDGGGE